MNNSVSYLTLFKTFTKIGIVTFGGGYAMIPIIEHEVVDKNQWMTKEEFLDAIAVTQTCPGALAINMSSMLGYKLEKLQEPSSALSEPHFPLSLSYWPSPCFSISSRTTRLWQLCLPAFVLLSLP